jgi:hypothetical protein
MNRHHAFKFLTLLSITALPLGTVACANHASPTEPGFSEDQPAISSSSSLSSVTGQSHGGDDPAGDDHGRHGQGADDPAGDDHGRHGQGADDPAGDDHGRHGGRNGQGNGGNGGNQRPPKAGQEFEGAVASVGQNSLTLANGTRIVVNAQTQWNARGDLRSLDQVASSVAAKRPTRAEGHGTRQADGSILASTLMVEVD